ncbi:MAG: hypothetical protein ACLR60_03635 [Clostridium paraputrificum]
MKFTNEEMNILERIAKDENMTLDNLLETIIKEFIKNNITYNKKNFSHDSNKCMVDIDTILNFYK